MASTAPQRVPARNARHRLIDCHEYENHTPCLHQCDPHAGKPVASHLPSHHPLHPCDYSECPPSAHQSTPPSEMQFPCLASPFPWNPLPAADRSASRAMLDCPHQAPPPHSTPYPSQYQSPPSSHPTARPVHHLTSASDPSCQRKLCCLPQQIDRTSLPILRLHRQSPPPPPWESSPLP